MLKIYRERKNKTTKQITNNQQLMGQLTDGFPVSITY